MINQLFLTAWDMWQYRNNRLHRRARPLALARHSVLDNRTEEDMIAGYAGMTQQTQHFIRSETLLGLKRLSLPNKQHWLDSIRLGRKEYAVAAQPAPAFEQGSNCMRAWQQALLLTQ